MIVGNGPVEEGAGDRIDQSDLVIRFNAVRNFHSAGRRTDVVAVCNTGRPAQAMLGSEDWLNGSAVAACREIWSVRDPAKFIDLRPRLALSHPELDDFCDDRTEDFAAFAASRAKRHRVIARSVHEGVDEALAAYRPEPYVVPSSGLIVVVHVLSSEARSDDEVVVAGFTHQGWAGHPFSAEKRLIDDFVAAGRLARLSSADLSSPSQGV